MLRTKNLLFVLALMAIVASVAFARNHPVRDYAGMVTLRSQDGLQVLTATEVLKATYSDSGSPGVFTSCASAGCVAPSVTIYSYSLKCPGLAGKTCTYDIQIAGQVETGGNSIASGENGLYQFLVDGAIPTGGGTDGVGYYSWQAFGPEFEHGTSYNVHSHVTNTAANQLHSITVNLSCQEVIGDSTGCFAFSGFQTLVVRVWAP